jgi:hypothetical protein
MSGVGKMGVSSLFNVCRVIHMLEKKVTRFPVRESF